MAERTSTRTVAEPQPLKSEPTNGNPQEARRPKTSRVLPTNRVRLAKQFEIIRAYGIASGPEMKAVKNVEVATLVKLDAGTIGLATPFLSSINIIEKRDGGWVPAPEVTQFMRAFEWNPETAAHKLAPLVERAWFMAAMLPRLRFSGTMQVKEAIELLAQEAQAGPQYQDQLRGLLDYAATVGLIQIEGEMVRLVKNQSDQSQPTATIALSPAGAPTPTAQPDRQRSSPLAAALFPSNAEGTVQFHISVRVNMAEFKDWEAGRIASFFSGIAQVLAARGKVEGMMMGGEQ